MLDMQADLWEAAFPHRDGILYVMKKAWTCFRCARPVKLCVEIDGAPPVCVPCAAVKRPDSSTPTPGASDV